MENRVAAGDNLVGMRLFLDQLSRELQKHGVDLAINVEADE